MLLFYKHILRSIQGKFIPCVFILVRRISQTVFIFYPVLASAALLVVGWQGVFSSSKLYPPSNAAVFYPLVFLIARFLFIHLRYFISMDYQQCHIWTLLGWWDFCTLHALWVPQSRLCPPTWYLHHLEGISLEAHQKTFNFTYFLLLSYISELYCSTHFARLTRCIPWSAPWCHAMSLTDASKRLHVSFTSESFIRAWRSANFLMSVHLQLTLFLFGWYLSPITLCSLVSPVRNLFWFPFFSALFWDRYK